MKGIVDILIIIAVISLVIGVIIKGAGCGVVCFGLVPKSFLQFSNTCLLVAIAWVVRQIWLGKMQEKSTD